MVIPRLPETAGGDPQIGAGDGRGAARRGAGRRRRAGRLFRTVDVSRLPRLWRAGHLERTLGREPAAPEPADARDRRPLRQRVAARRALQGRGGAARPDNGVARIPADQNLRLASGRPQSGASGAVSVHARGVVEPGGGNETGGAALLDSHRRLAEAARFSSGGGARAARALPRRDRVENIPAWHGGDRAQTGRAESLPLAISIQLQLSAVVCSRERIVRQFPAGHLARQAGVQTVTSPAGRGAAKRAGRGTDRRGTRGVRRRGHQVAGV